MSDSHPIQTRKLKSLISLSMKAGKVITGEDGCLKAIRGGKAHLVLLATDASANTRKKFSDKSSFYGVPCCCHFSKAEVEGMIGRPNRATVVIACGSFAASMLKLFDEMDIPR